MTENNNSINATEGQPPARSNTELLLMLSKILIVAVIVLVALSWAIYFLVDVQTEGPETDKFFTIMSKEVTNGIYSFEIIETQGIQTELNITLVRVEITVGGETFFRENLGEILDNPEKYPTFNFSDNDGNRALSVGDVFEIDAGVIGNGETIGFSLGSLEDFHSIYSNPDIRHL